MSGLDSEAVKMDQSKGYSEDECQLVSERIVVLPERPDTYGRAPGLKDEQPADIEELERLAFLADWGPILALPVRCSCSLRPVVDSFGHRDWGAFGTVDFQRLYGGFNKARYKAEKLEEELRNCLIMVEILVERVPGEAKYQVLKLVGQGQLDLDDIEDWDMHALARWHLRSLRLRREIQLLRTVSWRR